MDKALKLYLKAAEASGKTRLANRIRAMLEDEEKDDIEPLADKNGSYDNENGVSDNVITTNANNASVRGGEVKYSKKNALENYQKRIDAWDGKTEGFSFVLGESPEYLSEITISGKKIGNKQVRIDATKIKKIIKDHSEMTIEVIKQLPLLLNDPILVIDSKTVEGRLVLLGEVYANGKPVMMALEINPSTRSGNSSYIDVIKVASAYTRSNTQNLIDKSNLRYICKNKSRVDDWLKVNRLQLPLPSSQSDSAINSIPNSTEKVNSETKFSRKPDQDRSTLTKGEAQKQKANYESDKVYTKAEISKMVESLSGLSSIPKRFRTEIVNDIWTAFNSRYSPEQRERHASFLADKIFARVMQESGDAIDNTSQEDLYAMEREIHKALKKIAREGGSPSTRSKLEAEFNTSEAGYWKNVSTKLSSRNRGRFSGTKIKPEGSPIPNRLQIQAFAGSPLGRAPASSGERVVWNIIGFPLAKA